MAASAATRDLTYSTLVGPDGLTTYALYALADQILAQHHAAPVSDIAAFEAQLIAAATSPNQQQERVRFHALIRKRGAANRVRILNGVPQDTLFDLAETLAILIASARGDEAVMLANRYFDIAPQGPASWALLPLYVSIHLAAPKSEEALRPARPRLIAIGGHSGAGKSTLARLLSNRAGRAPGARVLRSDVFRKRLMGLPPEERLPPSHYTRQSDLDCYTAMFESAYDHLNHGNSVILDAVFLNRSEREVAAAMAERCRIPFTAIWLDVPERDRITRVRAREVGASDASDATVEVVHAQSRRSVGELASWHRIRANRPIETIIAAARTALDRDA